MRFEPGKTYWTRSTCDANCIWTFPIVARTAKGLTALIDGKPARRRIKIYDGCEYFMPFGSYSMAPTVRADRLGDGRQA